jgi:hypothetical protein
VSLTKVNLADSSALSFFQIAASNMMPHCCISLELKGATDLESLRKVILHLGTGCLATGKTLSEARDLEELLQISALSSERPPVTQSDVHLNGKLVVFRRYETNHVVAARHSNLYGLVAVIDSYRYEDSARIDMDNWTFEFPDSFDGVPDDFAAGRPLCLYTRPAIPSAAVATSRPGHLRRSRSV